MKDNFYQISDLEQGDGTLSCTISYNADHDIFKGHFPGNPVVPGVCTMAIIKAVLEEASSQKLMLKESGGVKFLGLINPGMTPQLTLNWKRESEYTTATATLKEGTTALFKMSAQYIQVTP